VPFLGGPITEAPLAVIFDIGRVIVRVNLARSLDTLTGHRSFSHEQALRELQADPLWLDWQEGRIAPQDWHKHICEKFHLSIAFDDFCSIWNSVLDPVPILPELLFERLAKSCRLALLSNTDAIHVAHMEATFPFVRHFPVRVYSCHVGASKPAPLIYHHALREIDALPEETMFIDDVRENAVAAASLGINAFHFTSAEELFAEFSRLGLWKA
jgi:FMN phosphatase YigB (HAD superfamily)